MCCCDSQRVHLCIFGLKACLSFTRDENLAEVTSLETLHQTSLSSLWSHGRRCAAPLCVQRYSSGHANRHKCLPSSVAVWDQLYFETVMKMNSDWSQRELTRGDKLAAEAKEQRGVVFAGGRQNHVVTDEITEQMFMCVMRRLYAESSGITF